MKQCSIFSFLTHHPVHISTDTQHFLSPVKIWSIFKVFLSFFFEQPTCILLRHFMLVFPEICHCCSLSLWQEKRFMIFYSSFPPLFSVASVYHATVYSVVKLASCSTNLESKIEIMLVRSPCASQLISIQATRSAMSTVFSSVSYGFHASVGLANSFSVKPCDDRWWLHVRV